MHPQISTWNTSQCLLRKQGQRIFHSPVPTMNKNTTKIGKWKNKVLRWDKPIPLCHENWHFAVSPTFPVWIHCPRALRPLSLPRHLLECPWCLDVFRRWMKVKVRWDGDLCNYALLFTRCGNRVFHNTRCKKLEKRTVSFAQNTLDCISASFAVFNENKKDSIMM
jgi:hypothetical protein